MATKFSDLYSTAPASALTGAEIIALTQSGVSKGGLFSQIKDFVLNTFAVQTAGSSAWTFETNGTPTFLIGRANNSNSAISLIAQKARGTLSVPLICATNDTLLNWDIKAHDGANYITCVRQQSSLIEAVPAVGAMQGNWRLLITAAGSATLTNAVNVDHTNGLQLFGSTIVKPNRHIVPRAYAAGSLPTAVAGELYASSDVPGALLTSDGTNIHSPGVKILNAVTNDTTISIPAGWAIDQVFIANTTANAVTGGIKIGTTSGATDVVAAQAVGANAILAIADSAILKRLFSRTVAQTLFIQDVTSWNSASLEISFALKKVF